MCVFRVEWNMVSAEEQQRVQRNQHDDGEFWWAGLLSDWLIVIRFFSDWFRWQVHRLLSLLIRMSLGDFCQNFDTMEVCHLSEDTLSETGVKTPWKCTSHHGRWIPQQGTRASLFTQISWRFKRRTSHMFVFAGPPQYNLTLLEEDDDPSDPDLTCSFLLALMQKHTRQRGTLFPLALHLYKVSHMCSPVYYCCNLIGWLDQFRWETAVYKFPDCYDEATLFYFHWDSIIVVFIFLNSFCFNILCFHLN